jgi:transcriptional regulator with XRE-family HTH domain
MSHRSATSIDAHVGARIRMRRVERNLSQAELGDAVGVSFQQIQKYERGDNRVSSGRLQQIADMLETTVAFFYEGQPGKHGGGDTSAMVAFMSSRDGAAIAEAFNRLPARGKIRRTVRDLVISIASGHKSVTLRGDV